MQCGGVAVGTAGGVPARAVAADRRPALHDHDPARPALRRSDAAARPRGDSCGLLFDGVDALSDDRRLRRDEELPRGIRAGAARRAGALRRARDGAPARGCRYAVLPARGASPAPVAPLGRAVVPRRSGPQGAPRPPTRPQTLHPGPFHQALRRALPAAPGPDHGARGADPRRQAAPVTTS